MQKRQYNVQRQRYSVQKRQYNVQKLQNIEENRKVRLKRLILRDEVSTGSDSDRVSVPANSTVLLPETRSLPLPVLTP